jgi:hypothetical protein
VKKEFILNKEIPPLSKGRCPKGGGVLKRGMVSRRAPRSARFARERVRMAVFGRLKKLKKNLFYI